MEIKDVLTIVDHTKESENAFKYAVNLAKHCMANLFVSCPVPQVPPMLYMATQFNRDWLEELVEQFKSEEGRLFEQYSETGSELNINFEWLSTQGDPQDVVLGHSQFVDIVVASRLRDSDNLVGLSAPAAGFLLESKTPVIVLPAADKSWQLPKSVLIAWDNSSTAAKATRQALPLLRMAERVLILTIETSSVESKNDEQNTDIAAYLTRHDVIVERKTVHHNNDDESAILMSEIKDAGCNLLVMGAYGHTRFREMIVGGMTRNILRQMPVPVFMAH